MYEEDVRVPAGRREANSGTGGCDDLPGAITFLSGYPAGRIEFYRDLFTAGCRA